MIPVLRSETFWWCPNCPQEARTTETGPHTRFHTCSGMYGLSAPLVRRGTRAKVAAVEREDYIGSEQVRLTEGRPIMALVTIRDEGQDVTVYAPTARGAARGLD